ISGYTFASLVAWADALGFQWTHIDDDCVLVCRPFDGEVHLLQPIGVMSPGCCERLLSEARKLPYPLRLLSVAEEFVAAHAALCARFSAVEDRAGANYIYLASDLASLPGRRYAKKRNLVAQFVEQHPAWET